jgi:hypothetical protein
MVLGLGSLSHQAAMCEVEPGSGVGRLDWVPALARHGWRVRTAHRVSKIQQTPWPLRGRALAGSEPGRWLDWVFRERFQTCVEMSLDAASLGARATSGIEARCSGGGQCGLAATPRTPRHDVARALKTIWRERASPVSPYSTGFILNVSNSTAQIIGAAMIGAGIYSA